ncbi:hypothetical protein [Aquimarina algicola]|uniref:Lipocalin-like domain-containing protein n=1 Tax=Aquimarina algicola TaxID=2589995 RepID=A0A504J8K1_9FLAO|nr:hypothetical protein [Aquimarina algicola]TPN87226.1 hypothetical protein FHK87_06460 [Aquimarina algicola]
MYIPYHTLYKILFLCLCFFISSCEIDCDDDDYDDCYDYFFDDCHDDDYSAVISFTPPEWIYGTWIIETNIMEIQKITFVEDLIFFDIEEGNVVDLAESIENYGQYIEENMNTQREYRFAVFTGYDQFLFEYQFIRRSENSFEYSDSDGVTAIFVKN